MGKRLVLYVDGDQAVTFIYPDDVLDVDFVKEIVEAASKNPSIVEITDLNVFPVTGMRYENNEFIEDLEKGLSFFDHSNLTGLTCFAYIVDNTVAAIHKVPEAHAPWIAALQSNPTFEVLDV
jgi:hypothetical protein